MSDDDMIRRGDAVDAMCKGPRTVQERIDTIRALPAVHVGVKPLEWRKVAPYGLWEAYGLCGEYQIRQGTDGVFRWQAGYMGTWRDAETLDAAKASAQADYEAGIRSSLTGQPSPDVAALAEFEACIDQLRGSTLRLIMRDEDCIDRPCHQDSALCECRAKLARIMVQTDAALARLKGGA